MQIDNYEEAQPLTDRIKTALPMRVRPSKHGLKALHQETADVTTGSWFTIRGAVYSGDEGGIRRDLPRKC